VFSAITAHATLIDDINQPIFDLARLVHDDIDDSAEDSRVFLDYRYYSKAFLVMHIPQPAFAGAFGPDHA
jgi:hypothetical protein